LSTTIPETSQIDKDYQIPHRHFSTDKQIDNEIFGGSK